MKKPFKPKHPFRKCGLNASLAKPSRTGRGKRMEEGQQQPAADEVTRSYISFVASCSSLAHEFIVLTTSNICALRQSQRRSILISAAGARS